MMPELSVAYGFSAMGIASMVGLFSYGYSPFTLVAGAAMDRLGPRCAVLIGGLYDVGLAIVLTFFLKETGPAARVPFPVLASSS
jgi:sugar phosphate permease